MRNFGLALVVLGIAAFIWCSHEMNGLDPVPEETSITKSLEYKSGRMEVGRYAGMATAALGLLLVLAPQGR
jgi:hypothetical protein